MISLSSRCKAALLSLMLLTTGQGMAISIPTFSSPISPKKCLVIATFLTWLYVRTASTKNDYKMSDWRGDLERFMKEFNVVEMYKKWIAGRRLTIKEMKISTVNENGEPVKKSDDYVKSTPFGLMGLFDAYFIQSLEKVAKALADFDKVSTFYSSIE